MPLCGRCRSEAEIDGSDYHNGVRDETAPIGLDRGETCDRCGLSGDDAEAICDGYSRPHKFRTTVLNLLGLSRKARCKNCGLEVELSR